MSPMQQMFLGLGAATEKTYIDNIFDTTLYVGNESSTTVTTVEYCWEKIPTTCPAQDEIAVIETFLDTFEDDLYLNDIYLYEEPGIPEFIDIEYSFNPEIFEEEEFEIEDTYLALDDFFLKNSSLKMTITQNLSWKNLFQKILYLKK